VLPPHAITKPLKYLNMYLSIVPEVQNVEEVNKTKVMSDVGVT